MPTEGGSGEPGRAHSTPAMGTANTSSTAGGETITTLSRMDTVFTTEYLERKILRNI